MRPGAFMNSTRFPTTRQSLAGIDIASLVGEFGTPTFCYDDQVIQDQIDSLRCFDVIRYAQKALSNIAILDRMRSSGVLVDAVSTGEIRRAITAGYHPQGDPHPIVYTADIFDHQALQLVTELGIHVNCGSPDMISQLGQVTRGVDVTLRINPGFGHGHSQKTNTGGPQSKHGIWHEQLTACVATAEQWGMTISGLHMHIGSGTDMQHLGQVAESMRQLVPIVGSQIRTISAGGGLSVPYQQSDARVDPGEYFSLWDSTRNEIANSLGHAIRLEIEPGRYLVAESGYLITEIRAVKQMGSNTFYLVDAGFNDLARPVLYGAHHPISVCHVVSQPTDARISVIVGGPLCESGDIFTQKEGGIVQPRMLPKAQVGDFLIIENVGAYGFSMASNYNSKPRAAEVLIRNQNATIIRQRESFEDLMRGETIPTLPPK